MAPVRYKNKIYDFKRRLQLPNHFIFCGASQSGKTLLFLKLLKNAKTVFNPLPEKVIFFYAEFQDSYAECQSYIQTKFGIEMVLIQGAESSREELIELADGKRTIAAFDDATMETSSSAVIAKAFMHIRHNGISMVLLQHTLFPKTKVSPLISQNTAYYFLMSSVRMRMQVRCLGVQLKMCKVLQEAYADATERLGPFGYLLVDMTTRTAEIFRLRTKIMAPITRFYVKA